MPCYENLTMNDLLEELEKKLAHLKEVEKLKHMVAMLPEDANAIMNASPNAGTAERIRLAKELLEK